MDDVTRRCAGAALAQIRPELDRISREELQRQNVVAVNVVTTVRGVKQGLMELRPLMQQLICFNIEHLDRLDLYATAFAAANAEYESSRERNKEPAAVIAEGIALRTRLTADIRVLVSRGLISPDPLKKLTRRRGYTQVSKDLLLLATLLRARSPAVAGRCATTEDEVARAEALADKLMDVVSRRGEPLKAEADALEIRKRAFTAFFRAYSQVRRAVQYLRYDEGDADRFAPPLTGRRKNSKEKRAKDEAPKEPKDAPETNAENHKHAGAATESPSGNIDASASETANSNGTNERAQAAGAALIGVGLPESDPFLG